MLWGPIQSAVFYNWWFINHCYQLKSCIYNWFILLSMALCSCVCACVDIWMCSSKYSSEINLQVSLACPADLHGCILCWFAHLETISITQLFPDLEHYSAINSQKQVMYRRGELTSL